jgi:hypothetical protein
MEFWGRESVRLGQAIRQAAAFASQVNAGIAQNASPYRFLAQEQSRLGRAIRQAQAFADSVNAQAGGKRAGPRELMKGGKVDLIV